VIENGSENSSRNFAKPTTNISCVTSEKNESHTLPVQTFCSICYLQTAPKTSHPACSYILLYLLFTYSTTKVTPCLFRHFSLSAVYRQHHKSHTLPVQTFYSICCLQTAPQMSHPACSDILHFLLFTNSTTKVTPCPLRHFAPSAVQTAPQHKLHITCGAVHSNVSLHEIFQTHFMS